MSALKIIMLFGLSLALLACTADYKIIQNTHSTLSIRDTYYVSTPENGQYDGKPYLNSGVMTRDILFAGLIERGAKGIKGQQVSREQAVEDAQKHQCTRVMYPEILHWEDRATEWSGIRDKVKVAIDIIDTHNGKVLDSTILNLTGTWWTMGGLHPQDLIEEASDGYFKRLFD